MRAFKAYGQSWPASCMDDSAMHVPCMGLGVGPFPSVLSADQAVNRMRIVLKNKNSRHYAFIIRIAVQAATTNYITDCGFAEDTSDETVEQSTTLEQ